MNRLRNLIEQAEKGADMDNLHDFSIKQSKVAIAWSSSSGRAQKNKGWNHQEICKHTCICVMYMDMHMYMYFHIYRISFIKQNTIICI